MDKIFFEKSVMFAHFEYELFKTKRLFFCRKFATNLFAKRKIDGEFSEITFFFSSKREDQNELFNVIEECCSLDKSRVYLKRIKTFNIMFLIGLIRNINLIKSIRLILQKRFGGGNKMLKECLYIYFDLVAQKSFFREVKKVKLDKLKVFVVLADILAFEQTVILYLKSKNIKTVTAQHAIYYDGDESVGKLNYYFIPSDYVLAWGANTERLIKKYNPQKKIYICGNPIWEAKNIDNKPYIAVAGDSIVYLEYTRQLVKIAEQYAKKQGIQLRVRLHPSDCEKNYIVDNDVTKFCKDIEEAQVILCHCTTMICRYLAEGRRVLRYKSDIKLEYIPEQIEFENVEGLAVLFDTIEQIDFYSLSRKNVQSCFIESREKYNKAFLDIYNDK